MKDFYTSLVRSIVPAVVAAVADFFAHWGLNIDSNGLGGLETSLFAMFYAVYYIVIRLFETHVHPKLGWLLGYPAAPKYVDAGQVTAMEQPDPGTAK